MVITMLKINLNIKQVADIYHPFNKKTLNPILKNFIYEECFGTKAKEKIEIHISCPQELTENTKKEISTLIKQNFKTELNEEKIKNTLANRFRNLIFFIGVLLIFFVYFIKTEFFHEFLLVLGWLAIWETVYDFLFIETKERIKRKRYQKIYESTIVFD